MGRDRTIHAAAVRSPTQNSDEAKKLEPLGVVPIHGRQDVFWWPHAYDPDFLGYMAGALRIQDFVNAGVAIY